MEALFASLITLIVCLGSLGAIVFTRQSMELQKQTISAMNICRDYMEQAHAHINVSAGTVMLDHFDTPGGSTVLNAQAVVDYFPIKNDTSGTIDYDHPLTLPDAVNPFYCRVTVSWEPPGSWGGANRVKQVRMMSIVRRGSL